MSKALILLVCALIIPVVACADLTIKEQTTVQGFMGIWTSKGTEVTYIKGDKVRNEAEVERSGVVNPSPIKNPPPRVVIFRGDKGLMWRVNLKDKTYAENSFEDIEKAQNDKVHFTVTDVVLEPTEEVKEIAGRECTGLKGSVTFEVDEGDETLVQPVDMFFWVTKATEGLEEMRTFWVYGMKLAQGMDQELTVGSAFDTIWQKLEELDGVPLGMELSLEAVMPDEEKAELQEEVKGMLDLKGTEKGAEASPNRVMITRTVLAISKEKLDDSLFEIPEGYKKASKVRLW
jgi:hypothetical protein